MRGRHFVGSQRRLTGLSVVLLVVVIAFPLFAEVEEPDYISTYRAKGQSQTQQACDRSNSGCWAISPTGLDPSKVIAQAAIANPVPSTGYQPSQPGYQPPRRHIVKGAGRGAALGAVGGAIAGDAGKGAAAGAAMGGVAGAFRRRDQRMQQNPPPR
ncbi:MAG: hypothetical protein JO189_02830 [Deltaproteobacteria bacterium]|nr:hypothetical protein [Deltaproteobacteria bacterium]